MLPSGLHYKKTTFSLSQKWPLNAGLTLCNFIYFTRDFLLYSFIWFISFCVRPLWISSNILYAVQVRLYFGCVLPYVHILCIPLHCVFVMELFFLLLFCWLQLLNWFIFWLVKINITLCWQVLYWYSNQNVKPINN
jgi:hypothetical protein